MRNLTAIAQAKMGAEMHGSNSDGADLLSIIERVEQLESERRASAEAIKEVYAEAKGRGYLTMPIRSIIKERRADPTKLAEDAAILDIYRAALGMV